MTPITRLLKQKTSLCLHAFEQTNDLNEAHFLVHGVMAQALSSGAERDLSLAMTDALRARAHRLAPTETSA